MLTSDFDYNLPPERIAQQPADPRDSCKLLVLNRKTGEIEHRGFADIVDYLNSGDLLVANETRVRPARLHGKRVGTQGLCELLLLKPLEEEKDGTQLWEALVKPGRRLKPGAVLECGIISAKIEDWAASGERGVRVVRLTVCDKPSRSDYASVQVTFSKNCKNSKNGETGANVKDGKTDKNNKISKIDIPNESFSKNAISSVNAALHRVGSVPLPPYITKYLGSSELYQTVYAKKEASAAAPTAGLHFTPELLVRLEDKGVGFAVVDLEVGLDTFRTVEEEYIEDHIIHSEYYSISTKCAQAVAQTRAGGGRVVAVGTTSVRSLESAWNFTTQSLSPCEHEATSLYITPGYDFAVTDALLTNFHVPRSTLIMLVSAFASRQSVMHAYEQALINNYRFLSFGDAMLIV